MTKPLHLILTFIILLSANVVYSSDGDELVAAARSGNLEKIQALLKQGVDADASQADGSSALHWAVLDERHAVIEVLLNAGADANHTDRYGTSPLSMAALNGDVIAAKLLLDNGANPNAVDSSNESVLMTAARTGDQETIVLLVERGAFVGYEEPQYGMSALMLAALENHPDAVATLARLGGRVNNQTHMGLIPPFVVPCKGGCGSEGVDINRGGVPDRGERPPAEGGMSPLLFAARDGNLAVARALISAGARIEQSEANEITPLLMATINGRVELALYLIDQGAEINVKDFYGRAPLFAAVEYRNIDKNNNVDPNPPNNGVNREEFLPLITRLLEQGANVDVRTREYPPSRRWIHARNDISWVDMTGQTPFVRAALAGDVVVMKLLLAHGADPFITTFKGTSALMAAAGLNWRYGQSYTESPSSSLEAVQLCIDLGLDVNAANSMGVTAMMGAANRASNDIIKLLVAEGAQINVKDLEGRTPLTWSEGVFLGDVAPIIKPDTVALLRDLGAK